MKGSWWAIPESNTIWEVLNRFSHRKQVLVTKLVSGKVTFVHRAMWKDFLSVATSGEAWQRDSLSMEAVNLLMLVEKNGTIRTDELVSLRDRKSSKAISKASLELVKRLLIHEEQIHTERGFHARILSSWKSWSKQTNYLLERLPNSEKAKSRLGEKMKLLNQKFGACGKLPWQA